MEINDFVQTVQQWSQQPAMQDSVLERVRALAATGDPVASALHVWMSGQRGQWAQAVESAERAIDAGYVQVAGMIVGSMMNDPTTRAKGLELAARAAPFGLQYVDPINQAINFASQGDVTGAQQMLETPAPLPGYPADVWASLRQRAEAALAATEATLEDVAGNRQRVSTLSNDATEVAHSSEVRVRAATTQLLALISSATNAQAASFFKSEADEAKSSADATWWVGTLLVGVTAFVAAYPILNYYNTGQTTLSASQLLGAHISAALGLAALSGVILTRSRVRDRSRQRNRDLFIALETMFSYGENIEDDTARQTFIREMGRVIIEAHLKQEASGQPDSNVDTLVSALAGRLRT